MRAILAGLAALWLWLPAAPEALAQPVPEYELKAAYLYNFALLTEWPGAASADAPFSICVIGRNPFPDGLASLQGRSMHGRKVAVRAVALSAAARGCQVLFIAAAGAAPVEDIVEALGEASVLTVADAGAEGARAAAIGLLAREQRVVFSVNLAAVRRAKLHVSPRLLRLAWRVQEE